MSSYSSLAHNVRLEHITAAANHQVYMANAQEVRPFSGISVTTAMRRKARYRTRGLQVILNLENLPELKSAREWVG